MAGWNPHLHPRGRDGRFIEIGAFVSWLIPLGRKRGRVTGVDATTGLASVDVDGETSQVLPSKLTTVAPSKASLSFKMADSTSGPASEKTAYHRALVERLLGDATPSDVPQLDLVLGGAGSGKTTLIDSGPLPLPPDRAVIDADLVMEMMPGYQEKVKAKDPKASSYFHEESTQVASQARGEAFDRGLNTVVSSVGSSYSSLVRRVKQARSEGYAVNAHIATIDPDIAVRRARKREAETGRSVPESFIRRSARETVHNTLRALNEGLYDKLDLYDTENEPKLIASAVANAGGGSEVTVVDWNLWKKFIARGQAPLTAAVTVINTALEPLPLEIDDVPTAYDSEVQAEIMVEIALDTAPEKSRFADLEGYDVVRKELAAEIEAGAHDVPFVLD